MLPFQKTLLFFQQSALFLNLFIGLLLFSFKLLQFLKRITLALVSRFAL